MHDSDGKHSKPILKAIAKGKIGTRRPELRFTLTDPYLRSD
jgi:hypothetical protein